MTKRELRQQLRDILANTPVETRHEKSQLACSLLEKTDEYARAEVIMVFLSLPLEVDTAPLALRAWRDRKRLLAPKISWDQRRMLPIEIRSLSDNLRESQLGIREPVEGIPFPIGNIDLIVVPGLGFDRHGNRIGRGQGFYDRFLAHENWHGVACGLAMESQVVDEVPVSDNDIRLDMLVTDRDVRYFRKEEA